VIPRLLACAALILCLGACAGVPAAAVWSTVGAGLGFGAAALKFDDDLLGDLASKKTPPDASVEPAPTP
jgi:hypothetical protein